MLISHEAPLSIMKDLRAITDYDYCLVHLLEEIPEYLDFFMTSKLMGRKIILDNSIFELGESFDEEKFFDWVLKLKPSDYIVPDSLEDSQKTISNARKYYQKTLYIKSLCPETSSIGVVQGRNYSELVACYRLILPLVDKIAISFNYSWYEEICLHSNKLYSWMYGRQYLLRKMLEDGYIDTSKKHHLLGCSLPQEFKEYSKYSWIESCDTSNPVVHAIKEIPYREFGLEYKESQKLVELINYPEDKIDKTLLFKNIKRFRELTK